jgi:hypothetical protein
MHYLVKLVICMVKKVHIIINLLAEASKSSNIQIEEKIRNEAKIPWCKNIEQISVEDAEESYKKLKKQGISSNVARNLVDLYTE